MTAKSLLKLALVTVGFGLALSASTVPVQFVSTASGLGGPAGNGVYYYPYQLVVNGSTVTVACDDYDNSVYLGEKWNATVSTFSDLSQTMYYNGGAGVGKYQQAAWLYSQFQPTPPLTNSVNAAINWAIWDIMDTDAPTYNAGNPTSNTSSVYWLNLAAAQNLSNFNFSDFVIYTPANGWPSADGMPQEYIGEVPEPGTMVLLLTGLLGLCCAAWKRRTLLS